MHIYNKDHFSGRPENESNDCSVRAFAVASGKSYAEVHALFQREGRKPGRRTHHRIRNRVAGMLGFRKVKLRKARTVRKFLEDMEYVPAVVAHIAGHDFAVVCGKIGDYYSVPPRCLVRYYFEPRG